MIMSVDERIKAVLVGERHGLDVEMDRLDMEFSPDYPYRLMGSFALRSLLAAREAARRKAVSYRGFLVGATALAFHSTDNKIGIFTGASLKVDNTKLVNVHAEAIALGKAVYRGYDIVPLISIVGLPQVDSLSGLVAPTLHPCFKCRSSLSSNALITDKTTVITATPSLRHLQIASLSDLIKLHETGQDDVTTLELEPDAANWDEVVRPHITQRVLESI